MNYLIISLFILIFGFFNAFNPLKNLFQGFTNPIQLGLNSIAISIKDQYSFYLNLQSVYNENLNLLQQIEFLNSELASLKYIEQENQILKQQINSLESTEVLNNVNLVQVQILGNPVDVTDETVVINGGVSLGIKSGNPVVIENSLIGVVEEVLQNSSIVRLVTSSQFSATAVDIDVEPNIEGVANGQFGTSIVLDRILPNEQVKVGDTIVTSGKDGLFIPGLVIGQISEVSGDAASSTKQVFVESFINLDLVQQAFVIVE